MTSEQRTWHLCSVSIIPAIKLSSQELSQLIGIKLLNSGFLEIFYSYSQFPGVKVPVLLPTADAHGEHNLLLKLCFSI